MELKNVNPNGCNVVINNVHLYFFIFFPKSINLLKIELKVKDFKVYLRIEIL